MGVVDAFEDGCDEIVGFLLEGEELEHGVRTEFDVEVYRFAGVVRRDGNAEEVIADVVEEHETVLPDKLNLVGLQQAN